MHLTCSCGVDIVTELAEGHQLVHASKLGMKKTSTFLFRWHKPDTCMTISFQVIHSFYFGYISSRHYVYIFAQKEWPVKIWTVRYSLCLLEFEPDPNLNIIGATRSTFMQYSYHSIHAYHKSSVLYLVLNPITNCFIEIRYFWQGLFLCEEIFYTDRNNFLIRFYAQKFTYEL
jgi:hypothetical protein